MINKKDFQEFRDLIQSEEDLKIVELYLQKGVRPTFKSSPAFPIILSGFAAIFGTALGAWLQGDANIKLENEKFESNLVIKMIERSNNQFESATNLKFLVNAGFIKDKEGKIARLIDEPDEIPVLSIRSTLPTSDFPKSGIPDNELLLRVFGEPSSELVEIIELPYPMNISWDLNKEITKVLVNKYAKEYFTAALKEIKEAGLEEKANKFGGIFNIRLRRGGTSYSNHSWGIGIDINPSENQLTWGPEKWGMDEEVAKIFEKNGFVWYGRLLGYDAMSFDLSVSTILEIEEKMKTMDNNTK